MQVRWKIIMALFIVAALVAVVLLPRHLIGSRVVARVLTPDGSELCVIQRGSFDELPWFNTSFFSRPAGGPWQWYYFHHEDKYWGRSRVSIDTNAQMATFYRRGSPAIAFDYATGSYTNVQGTGPAIRSQCQRGGLHFEVIRDWAALPGQCAIRLDHMAEAAKSIP